MNEHLSNFPHALRQRLAQPLPGREAQYRMAFSWRVEELRRNPQPPPDAKVACVTLLLWAEAGDWRTVLIRRTENPHDRHSGQVSFPGGRHDATDESLAATALRELHEEVGIPPASVEVLGHLTDLYIPVSNFVVHPFVATLPSRPVFVPQPGEVEAIFTPTLSHFQTPSTRQTADLTLGNGVFVRDVPGFLVEDRIVWGATAMILSEFLQVLAEV
jgi:8-oxo-dGTP pyrophosphatase MutT (NUDIX family)